MTEILALLAIIIATASFLMATCCLVWLIAQKLSTHRTEFVHVSPKDLENEAELSKKLRELEQEEEHDMI